MPDALHAALSPERWPTFVLLTARLGGLMLTAPGWSGAGMPRMVRAALVVVLAVLLLPAAPVVALPDRVLDLPLPLVCEMAIGLVIGLAAAVVMQAMGFAGEVLSMQMGLSIAPLLSPVPELEVVGVGPIMAVLGIVIYLGLGGHLILLRALAQSLRTLPPGAGLDFGAGLPIATTLVGQLFVCAVSAAAPVLVALLLTHVALAILGRAVPQLNAMMLSFPVTVGVGLLMLAASLPILETLVGRWVGALPGDVARLFEPLHR